jgi:cytochrome c oxidase subunit 2
VSELVAPGMLSTLDPAGPAAGRLLALAWTMIGVSLAASAVVIAIILWAVHRARRGGGDPGLSDTAFIVVGGFAIPGAILLGFLVLSVRIGAAVSRPASEPALMVEVTGHQFWWEVRYPDHDVVTANEIVIPAGQPVRVVLRAADVIHSFWVPRLHGKMDMNPSRANVTWLHADTPGVYAGGLRAAPPAAPPPAGAQQARGLEVFFRAGCAHCHAIRGISEPGFTGAVGPDLTRLAARRTLAAGIVPNSRGRLAAFILDPQVLKPGVRMPPTRLAPDDLDALLAYLEALR